MLGRVQGALNVLVVVIIAVVCAVASINLSAGKPSQHRVVCLQLFVARTLFTAVETLGLAPVGTQPLESVGDGNHQQRNLTQSPGDAAAQILLVIQVHREWEVQLVIKLRIQRLGNLHHRNTEPCVESHHRKQRQHLDERREVPRCSIHADDHPIEDVPRDDEVQHHKQVAGVLTRNGVKKRRKIEVIEADNELRSGDNRVRQEAREGVVDEHDQPFARARHAVATGGGQGAQ